MSLPDISPVQNGADDVLVLHGRDSIEAFDGAIDELARRCRASVTARWAWVRASIQQDGVQATACLLTGSGTALRGAAVILHHVDESGLRHVRLASGGDGHRASFLAIDDDAAQALGEAVAEVLVATDGPIRLRVGPVACGDPTLQSLLLSLPDAAVSTTVEVIPSVRTETSDVADYLSHGMRRTLRKSHNRLTTDGVVAEFSTTYDAEEIIALLPRVAAVSRERDHAGGRASVLDDESGLRRWTARLADLARLCHLELSALCLDGEPAAYVLGVRDGRTYRLIEGRFVMAWKRYAPGRLLEAHVLQRVLEDPDLDELDWMTSVAPETLLAANAGTDVVTVDLTL
ncbi:MAG TPA: GNAT family N-acetyltransferase [Mycobacteriales bacterium]|nr:GNAT family N-acetyltransferase [Mycobacteriales bacterium]